MADAVGAIKQIVKDYLQNESLSDVVYGTYTGSGVKIDSKPIAIPLDMVDIPEHLKEYKAKLSIELNEQQCNELVTITLVGDSVLPLKSVSLREVPCTIKYDALNPGDRVVIVQKQGNQKFAIIDKVES